MVVDSCLFFNAKDAASTASFDVCGTSPEETIFSICSNSVRFLEICSFVYSSAFISDKNPA